MEVGSRRPLHVNVTAHPTAEWTLQQLREALPGGHSYRFLLHDRDSIYSRHLDENIEALGVEVLRTPKQAPKANAYAERLIGALRRECLDFLISFGELHLRRLLQKWKRHYNRGWPHSSLGPGFPESTEDLPVAPRPHRHLLSEDARVVAHSFLGGVHHQRWFDVEKVRPAVARDPAGDWLPLLNHWRCLDRTELLLGARGKLMRR